MVRLLIDNGIPEVVLRETGITEAGITSETDIIRVDMVAVHKVIPLMVQANFSINLVTWWSLW